MAVTRDKLYEEVWAEAMLTVAARYGVSSTFLARVCDRLNVPRPPRGYWAKAAVGKAAPRPPLPPARPGDVLEWVRGYGERAQEARPLPVAPTEIAPTPNRRRRSGPHPLVAGVDEHFIAGRESDEGYLRPVKRNLVDLFVTKDTLSRALDLASRLFGALEDRGHRVVLSSDQDCHRGEVDERVQPGARRESWKSWSPARATVVFVGTVGIGLTIVESSEHIEAGFDYSLATGGKWVRRSRLSRPDSHVHKHDMPSGKLCLIAWSADRRASWSKRWPEARANELKGKVLEFALELEHEAPPIARLVEEGEREGLRRRQEYEAYLQKQAREEAERRRAKALKESREQFLGIVDAWGLAKRIEAFFEDAERRSGELDDVRRTALVERLRQARTLLGGVDALEHFGAWLAPEDRDRPSR